MTELHDAGPASLGELEARFRRDLELLTLPPAKDWLEPRTHPEYGPVLDVAVVGMGLRRDDGRGGRGGFPYRRGYVAPGAAVWIVEF